MTQGGQQRRRQPIQLLILSKYTFKTNTYKCEFIADKVAYIAKHAVLFFIRKSLKLLLSKALDPEQHGLGELSSRVIADKKVKLGVLAISFHMLRYH